MDRLIRRQFIAGLFAGLVCFPGLAQDRPGAEIYLGVCIICHAMSKHDAPQFGNVEHWQVRAARGLDELVPSAMTGIRKMPRMGANPALSDVELARAVIYMLNAAGSQFGAPSPDDLVRWRGLADERKKQR
jgi:mono/diheme cytochrome c family protein